MLNFFCVVVFHRSMVNWKRGALVYVHSAKCETYLMQWCAIDLWLIDGVFHVHKAYVPSVVC